MIAVSRTQGTLKTGEEKLKEVRGMYEVGPSASSVATPRALLPPEASDLETSNTSQCDVLEQYSSSNEASGNPDVFLEQFFRETSESVTLVYVKFLFCYVRP